MTVDMTILTVYISTEVFPDNISSVSHIKYYSKIICSYLMVIKNTANPVFV